MKEFPIHTSIGLALVIQRFFLLKCLLNSFKPLAYFASFISSSKSSRQMSFEIVKMSYSGCITIFATENTLPSLDGSFAPALIEMDGALLPSQQWAAVKTLFCPIHDPPQMKAPYHSKTTWNGLSVMSTSSPPTILPSGNSGSSLILFLHFNVGDL